MMYIDRTRPGSRDRVKTRGGRSDSSQGVSSSFESAFDDAVQTETAQAVDRLLGSLRDQERRFLDQQNMYEMQKYRTLVQQVLKMIVDGGLELSTWSARRSGREIVIVKAIDEKLLAISHGITTGNKAFNLLEQLDDIRGLLLDLMH